MRTLFYEFPGDKECWNLADQYMYGDRYLCCPVLTAGVTKMIVYLPCLAAGQKWKAFSEEETWEGGQTIEIDCVIDTMPVFSRVDSR